MRTLCKSLFCLLLITLLIGCATRDHLAPVSELKSHAWAGHSGTHIVKRGETLYAIAFRYDTDYRKLALLNHVRPPYSLRVGQILKVQGVRRNLPQVRPVYTSSYKQPVIKASPRVIYSPVRPRFGSSGWLWPVNGRVITGFVPTQGKKGINIACKKGDKVYASSAGIVAYSGSGLAGYGNLIIIKHSNEYLTAYGNNARNLVSEGQKVKAGQSIAEAGVIDRKYWGVHFEIRKVGVPVNPLSYLQKG